VTRRLAAHPARIATVVALLTLLAFWQCVDPRTLHLRLAIDASPEALLPTDDPARAAQRALRRSFGGASPLWLAVTLAPRVFTADNLARVARIAAALRAVPAVRTVTSLADAPNPRSAGDDIDVSSFVQQARRAPQDIARLQREFDTNPQYRGTLVSRDGRSAAFVVTLADDNPAHYRRDGVDAALRAAVATVVPGAPVWITGAVAVRAAALQALSRTLWRVVPAVFGVILLLLLLAFASLPAALLALLTVSCALIWTLALAAALGWTLNLVTTLVPPLVVTIGLSYTLHLLSAWRLSPASASAAERRAWIMRRLGLGLSLSAATTIAGFLSLLLNPLPAVHQFALLAAAGTACTALLTGLLLPALLPAAGAERGWPGQPRFAGWARRLAAFDRRYRALIVLAALLLTIAAVVLAGRVRADAAFIASFDSGSTVRRDFESINRAFDGADSVEIRVHANRDHALTTPAVAAAVDALDGWLRAQPEVGAVSSYVDTLKTLDAALRGSAAPGAVPPTADAIRQELLFGGGDVLRQQLDAAERSARIVVRLRVDRAQAVAALLQRLQPRLAALPDGLQAQVTGGTVLATRAVAAIASGHLASVAIATATIWLLLSLMFTSARAGLLATLPNLVPVAVYFGTLGALRIPLDATTSLIACIVLGIAVNDTIHFLARFNADARALADEHAALERALGAVLRPITLATLALCLGFLAFTGGVLHSQAQFGALAAFTLALAWITDMTLTPALTSRLHIVTLWDLLRLDLGANPQHTIPLLSGLSTRQARQFALTSRLDEVAAGTRLIHEGELARDVYVIVDGEVEVWVCRHGEHRLLSRLGRGAVIGEAGYFGQRRTASVDAVGAVRLLRFDAEDLERLRRRYPRVAAIVLRNINRIQAERIAHMTAMVS